MMNVTELAAAKQRVADGTADVIVLRDGCVVAQATGRGIAPLLRLFDEQRDVLREACVVDKVVGRAAAAVCVLAGVREVYGLTMSTGAIQFLSAHGITCAADVETAAIRNRTNTGSCPMEAAVRELDVPDEMLAAVRAKIKQLQSNQK